MTYEEYLRNRLDHLNQNSHYGIMIDTEITDIVRRHIKRLEENKMKATSTEEFKDIIAIDFELQTFPNPDVQDKFIVSATNRDDIFAFVFEGPNIVDACRKTGMFAGWEKDQKIRELEKENEKLKTRISIFTDPFTGWDKNQKIKKLEEENKNLKKHIKRHADNCRTIAKRNDELRKELALEKAANEAQHKFIRDYAGKGTEIQFNYAIDDTKEVSYVIVDKKTYDEKPNVNLHGKDYTPDDIVDMVLELEEENNRLKHEDMLDKNAADYWSNEHDTLFERFKKLQEENEKIKEEFDKECEKLTFEKMMLKEENKQLKEEISRCNKVNEELGSDAVELEKKMQMYKQSQTQKIKELKKKLALEKATNETPENPLTRAGILDQAKKCVCGQREQDYGTPESNFQLIADLWNGYLFPSFLPIDKPVISATDVSMMMALMKIARIKNGGGSGDSFVDLAGYAACGGEIWHGQKVKDQN